MDLHHTRIQRWLIACMVMLTAQLWPHQARGTEPASHRALEGRETRPPTAGRSPGWPGRPSPTSDDVASGAEPMAMLPAEQHMGEFSEADLAFIARAAVIGRSQSIYAAMALRRAKRAEVRDVAQRIAAFHRKARTDLANVVRPYGVVLPTGIDAEHQWLRAHLLETDNKAFDRLYLKSQLEEHASAVRIFHDQLNHGKSAQLRAWARGVLTRLEEHRQILQSLDTPKPVS